VAAQVPDPTPGTTQPVREQNLDGSGAIRVHEQGTADVNVTNGSLSIGGSVSVNNFPPTQNVFVTGGTLDAASLPPLAQIFQFDVNVAPGESHEVPFNTTFNAATIVAGSLREGAVDFLSPLAGGHILGFALVGDDGDGGVHMSRPSRIRCQSTASDLFARRARHLFHGVTILTP
jgi:hypothetical protein